LTGIVSSQLPPAFARLKSAHQTAISDGPFFSPALSRIVSMSRLETGNQPPAFMAASFFDFGDIRTATARLAANAIFQHPQHPCTARKAAPRRTLTAQYAPRMRRTGGVGKRRRVDPGNGTMSPV
jgi:hypothetical protein